jgi:hypothetical protein
MTKHDSELKIWSDEERAADSHVTSPFMSEEAVDQMLETYKGAASYPTRHEFDLQRPIREAAVEAARDGNCIPPEEHELPHHHAYGYEVVHPWEAASPQ